MWTKFINKYHLNLYHHNPTGKSVRIFCEGASLQTLILAKMIRLTFKMTCCTFVIPQILLAGSQIRSYLTQYILNFSKLLFKLINYHCYIVKSKLILPLSWRRSLSYRNQSIDLQSKWFLYDTDLRHWWVNGRKLLTIFLKKSLLNLMMNLWYSPITTPILIFSVKDFFSKCDQIRRKLQIWSHLFKNLQSKTSV